MGGRLGPREMINGKLKIHGNKPPLSALMRRGREQRMVFEGGKGGGPGMFFHTYLVSSYCVTSISGN